MLDLARRRRPDAEALYRLALAEDYPDTVEYLYDIFKQLSLMREFGMSGPLPFSPALILAGAQLFGWTLAPLEVEALVQLDHAFLHPGPWPGEEPIEKKDNITPLHVPAWPSREVGDG